MQTLYNNMIENIVAFLTDDCYVYIMNTGSTAFNKLTDMDDFCTFEMVLCSEMSKRMNKIYTELGVNTPVKLVNQVYAEIVFNTIKRIKSENHPFLIGLNVTQQATNQPLYTITFLKKKIEPVAEFAI